MAETIKFAENEVSEINQLRTDVSNLFTRLGQIEIEKRRRLKEIEDMKEEVFTQHDNFVEKEQSLFKALNDKYGDGNYNPETGEFTPSETEKVSSEVENEE